MQQTSEATQMAADYLACLGNELAAGSSETLVRYLQAMAKFYRYSFYNCCLIAVQRPNATRVAGYKRWKEMGRHVRAGEKGIMILAPCLRRPTAIDPEGDADSVVTSFTTTYVWDIKQTDGEPLPEFAKVTGDVGDYLARLKGLVLKSGIGFAYADDLEGALGISHGGDITLLRGLDPAEELHTLAHELGHELLHRGSRRIETTRQVREVEAEAVAYVVSRACGLDTNTASSDYLRLYGGDETLLGQSLLYIQRVSSEILDYVIGG